MYKIILLDRLGREIKTLSSIGDFTVSRGFNVVGSATIQTYDDISVGEDYRFAIYRDDYLVGNTHWFIKKIRDNGESITLECADALMILQNAIVAYARETSFSEKTIENSADDPADNLMKQFVRENLGSAATDTDRDLSAYLSIEPDLSLGPVLEKSASQQEILSVLTSLANDSKAGGVDLYFDIVPRVNDLYFIVKKSYLGDDRTNLIFSEQYGNLAQAELLTDYSIEKTVVYVGGYGRGAGQIIRKVSDSTRTRSPFSIKETSINRSDIDVLTVLDEEGETELGKLRAKQTLTGSIVENEDTIFGRDFFYGDLVTMSINNIMSPAAIRAFSLSVTNGEESLDIRLEGTIAL